MGGITSNEDSNPKLDISIGGSAMEKEELDKVIDLVVDQSLHLPSMFMLHIIDELKEDGKLEFADKQRLAIGREVSITIKAASQGGRSGKEQSVFEGEITAIEPEFNLEGRPSLVIRGYDKSHRLHRGKWTRTFVSQTDDAIVKKLVGASGLKPQVRPAATEQHEYLLQNNMTDMEFLQQRAQRLGYQVYADTKGINFKKTVQAIEGPEVTWKEELLSFKPRMTGAHQVEKATAYGWDPKTQKQIEGKAPGPTDKEKRGGLKTTGGKAFPKEPGEQDIETVITDLPVANAAEAKGLAQSALDRLDSEFLQAEGVCTGDPTLQPGVKINIKGVGTRFSGKYLISETTHIYKQGEYKTQFTVTGSMAYTITNMLSSVQIMEKGRMYGVVTGVVTNLEDPQDLGRVKIKFDWLMDNTTTTPKPIETFWARIATPMAGPQTGFFWLPEINDEVLVAFEHGDPNYPFVIGYQWNSKSKPPKGNKDMVGSDKKVDHRMIKSRSGHIIDLVDKNGEEQIGILSKSGHNIVLDDKSGKEQILIRDKSGNNSILIDTAKNTITIESSKDVAISAKGNISLKSPSGDVSIEGKNVTIKATMQGSFEGTAGLQLKGAPPAQIDLKGKVDINSGALEVT
jgi:uncharacterized protein involved in type VI secretion and phage assembly